VLVYAALLLLFQSWIDPFIIMRAVPGALIGIALILCAERDHDHTSCPWMGAIQRWHRRVDSI